MSARGSGATLTWGSGPSDGTVGPAGRAALAAEAALTSRAPESRTGVAALLPGTPAARSVAGAAASRERRSRDSAPPSESRETRARGEATCEERPVVPSEVPPAGMNASSRATTSSAR